MHELMNAESHFRDNNLLMKLLGNGDQQAFTELYDEHATLVYSVCLRILADPEEARDITQTVFLTLCHSPGRFNPCYGRLAAWLAALARNRSLDRIRRMKLQKQFVGQAYDEATGTFQSESIEDGIGADELEILKAALRELPGVQRQAVELAFFGSLTHEQIAHSLDEPLGTVKARIRRGLLKLREKCGELAVGRSGPGLPVCPPGLGLMNASLQK